MVSKSRKQPCGYCGRVGRLTKEHIVPLAMSQKLRIPKRRLDARSNIIMACERCNNEKGCMHPKDWFQKHPEYLTHVRPHMKYVSDLVKELCGLT